MGRPFPVDIIPTHVYLSAEDQTLLFGAGYPMTILEEHTQPGQVIYKERVEIIGRLKRSIHAHVLGPVWEKSHVEVTPTEAVYLGYQLEEMRTGMLEGAPSCTLRGPAGEVVLKNGVIVPRPHLTCSVEDAKQHNLSNGQEVNVDILTRLPVRVEGVLVRVHPMLKARVELHADYARHLWIAKQTYARITE
jgi:putative phosphotransacetylase